MNNSAQKEYFSFRFLKSNFIKICLLFFLIIIIIASLSLRTHNKNRLEKSLGYFEVLNKNLNLDIVDIDKVKYIMNILRNKYSDTNYAYFGSLLTARALRDNGDLQGACDELRWVYDTSDSEVMKSIASLRISCLLLDQGKYQESMVYLEEPCDSFFSLFADKKGDIFFAKNNIEEAVYWWSKAMESIEENDPLLQIIQSKLDSVSFCKH